MGDVRTTLDRAVAVLCDGRDVRLVARSSDYRTPPWGVTDQPAFINLALVVETALAPRALLARALAVEAAFGRDRAQEQRWGPRTLDIDIIAYDDIAIDEPGLTLPHPRAVRARLRAGAARRDRTRPRASRASGSPMRSRGSTERHREAAAVRTNRFGRPSLAVADSPD